MLTPEVKSTGRPDTVTVVAAVELLPVKLTVTEVGVETTLLDRVIEPVA